MVFSNLFFLYIFIPLFALANILFNKQKNLLLICFSIIFYAWGEPIYIFLLLFSIIVNYFLAENINRYRYAPESKTIFKGAIIFNISLLVVFKYFNLLSGGITHIPLPLGISFYTFQIISYIVDVYKGEITEKQKFSNFLLYVSMFPQLIAGPIVRYQDISAEINNRHATLGDIYDGVTRFIIGLGKKVLIADILSKYVSEVLNFNDIYLTKFSLVLGIAIFVIELYFDFSGYSDMAIGMGRCLGFHFKENFNYPFTRLSLTDFWRNWHMSLTSFFKDYVYIPLGGNKKNKILNILIVWMLTGFWHGAKLNYLLWGLILGIFIIFEKYCLEKVKDRLPRAVSRIYFIIVLIFTFSFFYFEDFNMLKTWYNSILTAPFINTLSFEYFMQYIWVFLLSIICSTPIYHYLEKKIAIKVFLYFKTILAIIILILSTLVLIGSTNIPFLYFRF